MIFASYNLNKLLEIQPLLGNEITLDPLIDYLPEKLELPETGTTFKENALQKAEFVYKQTGMNCLSEDSGLCVESLDGMPGIYSARYSKMLDSEFDNTQLLLNQMIGEINRSAKFVTCICYYSANEPIYFEGILEGKISINPAGKNGFGYDPIFIPNGSKKTLSEMELLEKIQISHRTIAFEIFKNWYLSSTSMQH